jgi:threonine aldolase
VTSPVSDTTLPELAQLVDAFYIGGTKNGALIGEAIVVCTPALQPDFRFHLKQRGALLAKGRLIGAQFLALFTDGLYFDLARHANAMAAKLAQGLAGLGCSFLTSPETNQVFPILPNALIEELQQDYGFYTWAPVDAGRSAVRLVTSWATQEENVDQFIRAAQSLITARLGL